MPRPAKTTKVLSKTDRQDLELLEALCIEAFSAMVRAMIMSGVPESRLKQLFRKASRSKKVFAASEFILEQFHELGGLLTTWLEQLPYVDANGKPKILPIRGRGATFESLARQCMPERSVEEAVALACKNAKVGKLSGNRIAIYGSSLVKIAGDKKVILAQIASHIVNIINTVSLNRVRAKKEASLGLMERLVRQRLGPQAFEQFRLMIRPSITILLEHADTILKSLNDKTPRSRRIYSGGLGVYVYQRKLDSTARLRPRITRSR